MTFAEALKRADLDGYRARPHPLAPIARDDRDYCEQSFCPRCGARGREYRPFVKQLGTTTRDEVINYVFFAACRNADCQHTEEL